MARQVLENGVILPAEYSDDWYDDMTSNLTKLDDVIGSDSEKLSSSDVGAAALSNNYNDLDNLPTIPTVNDGTLTIQKNGVDVQTFTANASSNVTANITVPTKTSDLTNDSNFVDTSNSAVSSGITSAKVTSYDSHIADTDIHVTTADKNKWNNGVTQAYVFRYSSTALTPSSTNANSLLDNTDNLKVGDKVIDSNGVLFSITAIDTQNSTFTIGTALIDLAQDSDVVHKSGDETISGVKSFSSNVNVYNSDSATDTANIILKNSKAERGSTTNIGEQTIFFLDKDNAQIGNIKCDVDSNGYSNLTLQCSDTNDTSSGVQVRKTATGVTFQPTSNSQCYLGQSIRRWYNTYTSRINNLEPSSLSLPDLSNAVDISSYITDLAGSPNIYSPPANGYIVLRSTTANVLGIIENTTGMGSFSRGANQVLAVNLPVVKNSSISIYVICSSLTNAYFIPCQGNV